MSKIRARSSLKSLFLRLMPLASSMASALVLGLLLLASCGAPGDAMDPNNPARPDDPPCSCATGDRRCIGNSVQVCELDSPTCSSWGALVACPSGMCGDGACKGDCQDSCPAGSARCSSDSSREVCRIGGSGCLEWVKQDCASQQYCDQAQSACIPVVPCDTTCPKGYMCRSNGICAGGSPTDLILNVPTVKVSGSVTLNGAAPVNGANCDSLTNPDLRKARVTFTEKKYGYTFNADLYCRDSGYDFTTPMYPGTYRVTVSGYTSTTITNLPSQGYVADSSFVVSGDVTGKLFDVKKLTASGRITLNGAAPVNGANCDAATNPDLRKARVTFTEKTYGYSFSGDMYCRDAGYNFTTPIYAGTYTVTVSGYTSTTITNLPSQGYVADSSFVVSADVSGKAFDVKKLTASGRITLNGAAPVNGPNCDAATNPDLRKARVTFTEKNYGYSFSGDMYCRDAGYNFTTPIYAGTYTVAVSGYTSTTITNLPSQGYVADSGFVVSADVSGKVFDVKKLNVSGSVTINGKPPANGPNCDSATNPDLRKARVTFTEKTYGYSFNGDMYCRDTGYAFATPIYAGTYNVTVSGYTSTSITNLPSQGYVADSGFAVTVDATGKVFDVKTLMLGGSVTMNGKPPVNGPNCDSATNPDLRKARATFTEKNFGYSFNGDMYCRDSGYSFTTPLYPGTYTVTISGYTSTSITNLPSQGYVADGRFVAMADASGKGFDVKTLSISGRVTLNDLMPMNGANCDELTNPDLRKARVTFNETTYGYSFNADMYCRDSEYAFSTVVYPGLYSATVSGYTSTSITNLPSTGFVSVPRLQLP